MNIDKLLLEYFSYTYELGIYTQILKILLAIIAPLTAVGIILMPYFSKVSSFEKKEELYQKLSQSLSFLLIVSTGMFFGLQTVSSEVIMLVLGNEFLVYEKTFRVAGTLILTAAFYNFIIQQILFPLNREKIYLYAIIFSSIIKVFLLYFLVPRVSLEFIMGIYIFCEILILLFCMYYLRKEVDFKVIIVKKNVLKIFISGLLMFTSLSYLNLNLLIHIIFGVIIYLLLLILFNETTTKKILINACQNIKRVL